VGLLGGTVTRSSILDSQSRHGHTIGSFDLSDHTVGGDAGCEGNNECVREIHLGVLKKSRLRVLD
jgi:hypothetical protein